MEQAIIRLIIQVFLDGIIIFIIQKCVERTFEKKKSRERIKGNVYKNFYQKVIKILWNMKNVSNDGEELQRMSLEVVSYYYTYEVILNHKNSNELIRKLQEDSSITPGDVEEYAEGCRNILEKLADNTLEKILDTV